MRVYVCVVVGGRCLGTQSLLLLPMSPFTPLGIASALMAVNVTYGLGCHQSPTSCPLTLSLSFRPRGHLGVSNFRWPKPNLMLLCFNLAPALARPHASEASHLGGCLSLRSLSPSQANHLSSALLSKSIQDWTHYFHCQHCPWPMGQWQRLPPH